MNGTVPMDRRTIAVIVEWLHSVDAAWVIEKARRDGVPEYATDRLAEVIERKWGQP